MYLLYVAMMVHVLRQQQKNSGGVGTPYLILSTSFPLFSLPWRKAQSKRKKGVWLG